MIIYLPLFISLCGLLMFLLARQPASADIRQIGFAMFQIGLLAYLLGGLPHLLTVVK